ncbi:hypothetical protein UQ81_25000, partial [Shigella dysenteriae]
MIFNLWLCLFMVFVLNCLRSISFLKFNISSQNNVTLLPFILSSKLICCVDNNSIFAAIASLTAILLSLPIPGDDSNLLIVFYVQIMPDD